MVGEAERDCDDNAGGAMLGELEVLLARFDDSARTLFTGRPSLLSVPLAVGEST